MIYLFDDNIYSVLILYDNNGINMFFKVLKKAPPY